MNAKLCWKKFVDRKTIADNVKNPALIRINSLDEYPIFMDLSEKILITAQLYAGSARYALELTEQLVRKGHVVHARATYSLAKALWNSMHFYGFMTEQTASRHIRFDGHNKKSPLFGFHLIHEQHGVVHIKDTVEGDKLTNLDIEDQHPLNIVVYLHNSVPEKTEDVMNSNLTLEEKLFNLKELHRIPVTKITIPDIIKAAEIPDPSSLNPEFNHIVLANDHSEMAFQYKNRIHMRDTWWAMEIYLRDFKMHLGADLHSKPLLHGLIVRPNHEPEIHKTYRPALMASYIHKK